VHAIAPLRHATPLAEATVFEAEWMRHCAESGQAQIHIWQAPAGWVVPRRYTQAPGWKAIESAAKVQVRASGGGLVAQGPGIWNLSLVWHDPIGGPLLSSRIYTSLCARLGLAFRSLGLVTHTGQAPGSLCDGRFNLLLGNRKLAGTAQAWRRIAGQQIGLFHAVFFLRVNPESLAEEANQIEEEFGHPVRYLAASMTSLHREVQNLGHGIDPEERFVAALAASLHGVFHPLPGHDGHPSSPCVTPHDPQTDPS
jgi:lipoate-protein ligase A